MLNAETQEDQGLGYVSEQAFKAVNLVMKRRREHGWEVSTIKKVNTLPPKVVTIQ